ncbi:hypothetical protein [Roseicella frigidaeris]|uniref:Uncharacterized protein n=1 Tax=Roseicella frigidaeris TaxID=2230885 RepID=A0A327MA75_9PROT|nr:hypothetical protein [Roseicella frigidaeris]RAI59659.1 hypothetical protein DOO78_08720 [Roseicella frigidaeris]
MRRFLGRLGFIHRHLWRRDGLYRVALLAGPAPLLGVLLALAAWAGLQALVAPRTVPPPPAWAARPEPGPGAAAPLVIAPDLPLPPGMGEGALADQASGWAATIKALLLQLGSQFEIPDPPLRRFALQGPVIEAAQLQAMLPTPVGLHAMTGTAFLAIRQAGRHALTLRVERQAGERATCLGRLDFGGQRIMEVLNLNMQGGQGRTFPPRGLELQRASIGSSSPSAAGATRRWRGRPG